MFPLDGERRGASVVSMCCGRGCNFLVIPGTVREFVKYCVSVRPAVRVVTRRAVSGVNYTVEGKVGVTRDSPGMSRSRLGGF